MPATFEEVRKKFVDTIVRSDYLSNRVGFAPIFYECKLDEDIVPEPRIPRFFETYHTGGEKDYVFIEMIPQWGLDLEKDVINLETLLAQYPELQKDIDYADHLAEKFETDLRQIHKERADMTIQEVGSKLNKLVDSYKETQRKSNGFYHETDADYSRHLEKKEAETNRPREGGIK